MIDFHSHLLPKIDDGSKGSSQSVNMLRLLRAEDVDTVVATPHFYADSIDIPSFLGNRDAAFKRLASKLPSNEVLPRILRGAEVLLDCDTAENPDLPLLCIERTNYILIEMPYAYWSEWVFRSIYDIIAMRNLTPVIAHVERYVRSAKDISQVERLLDMDVYAQVNAYSLTRFRERRIIFRLMREGGRFVLGSDLHNDSSDPCLVKASRLIERRLGDSFSRRIDRASARILRDV